MRACGRETSEEMSEPPAAAWGHRAPPESSEAAGRGCVESAPERCSLKPPPLLVYC